MEIALYTASAILGILFRYNLGLTQSCKIVGINLSDTESDTGFQDAITPPSSSNVTLVSWIVIIGLFVFTTYQFGWGSFGISFAVFLIFTVVAGAIFIPKPESKHYLERIYTSMKDRCVNYEKSGDTEKNLAMKNLIEKYEGKYGENL